MNTLKIIIFWLTFQACSGNQNYKPKKIKNIPEKAFWVGGSDGGNWYLVDSIVNEKNKAQIRVYNDNNGSLIISKWFKLICQPSNQLLIENLKRQINAFDGERILLIPVNGEKSCWLE